MVKKLLKTSEHFSYIGENSNFWHALDKTLKLLASK